MDRFTVEEIECDSDHAFTPNERAYKIRDNLNNTLSLSAYKKKERAEEVAKGIIKTLYPYKNGHLSTK